MAQMSTINVELFRVLSYKKYIEVLPGQVSILLCDVKGLEKVKANQEATLLVFIAVVYYLHYFNITFSQMPSFYESCSGFVKEFLLDSL